uniref:UDP-galactose transporter homolog 1 n=1 Tax=Candidozyma auris TaxID=498019 RepID=A0A0L0NRI8_CANAR
MKDNSVLTLILCVLGLYVLFLSWSLLQERINTKPYEYIGDSPVFFKAPLLVNTVQAFFACLVGLGYSILAHKQNPFEIFESNASKNSTGSATYVRFFIAIAITSTISSPLGYKALKHVDYLAFLLAKSCKLLPVMLVHFVLYKTRFPPHKYMVAGMVTLGVILFTTSHSSERNKTSINDGNIVLGMLQLAGSMLLDGLMNSTQDQIFKLPNTQHKLTGASLMCILNLLVCLLSVGFILIFQFENEALYAWKFVQKYPQLLIDILAFSILGAAGQVFVFLILEKFDSIILVTATVTRKMISMILSVLLFGHKLSTGQWLGVLFVFGGIGYESYLKLSSKKKKQE